MADEREILFTLNTVTDPQVAQQLKKLADDVKKAEDSGTKAAQRAAKQRLDSKIEEVRKRANAERLGLQNDVMFMALSVKQQDKVLKNRQRLLTKFHADQRKARQRAAKEQEREIIRLERLQQAAANKIVTANERMVEGISGGTEALAKIGRGWTALGIVSGKTLEEQVQALIKIQATFDLVVGTIEAGRNAFKILRGIRNAITAANAAQQLAAAAAARSAQAAAANTAALGRESVAANSAAVAHGRLAAARLASAATGTASAGQAAGQALGGGLLRGAGAAGIVIPAGLGIGLAAASGLAFQIARDRAAGARSVAGGGALTGSFTDRVVGGTTLRAAQGLESFGINLGMAGNALEQFVPFTHGLGEEMKGLGTDIKNLRKSTKDLSRVQERFIFQRAQRRIAAAERGGERRIAAAERQAEIDRLDFDLSGRRDLTPGQRALRRIQGQEAIIGGRLTELRGRATGGRSDEQREIQQEITTLERERISLARQRRDVEFSIADQSRSLINAQIQADQQRLESARQRVEVGRAAAVSVVERFGQLDREQQARILRIQAKVKSGAQLTRREAQVARQFGSRELTEAARRADIARGRAAGGVALAGGEVAGVRQAEAEQRSLERRIAVQQEFKVELELDTEEMARLVTNQVTPLLERQVVAFRDGVERGVREEIVKINNQADEERRAAAQGAQ